LIESSGWLRRDPLHREILFTGRQGHSGFIVTANILVADVDDTVVADTGDEEDDSATILLTLRSLLPA